MNQYQRACQIWAVLVYAASKSHIITYVELSAATGMPHFGFNDELGLLQDYCNNQGMPPLTALIVSSRTGEPEAGCDLPLEKWPAALQQIFQHNWTPAEAPTPGDLGEE